MVIQKYTEFIGKGSKQFWAYLLKVENYSRSFKVLNTDNFLYILSN